MAAQDNRDTSLLASAKLAADNDSLEQSDPFWVHEEIDAARWNQVFPYQLLLVKRSPDGRYFQDALARQWSFTLPFPPESLDRDLVFGIRGSVTQGGYAEEHGGAPKRAISLQGTLGVLPLRPRGASADPMGLGQSIFAGTVQAAQRLAASAVSLVSATGAAPPAPNVVPDSEFDDADASDVARTTGYYQMRKLEEFFENYATFKLSTQGRDYRLAFAVWKHQAVYLVTPLRFRTSFNKDRPLEPRYQLAFDGWRRISLSTTADRAANQFTPATSDPGAMQRLLKGVLDARAVLEDARDVLAAAGGDIRQRLFEPLRQTTLFARDALSAPVALADLPTQVLGMCQDAVVQYAGVQRAATGLPGAVSATSAQLAEDYEALAQYAARTGAAETRGGTSAAYEVSATDPALDVFRHPEEHYELFSGLQPAKLQLAPTATRAVQQERERVRLLKRLDFEVMRDSVVQVAADFADAVGAGDAAYDATYQRQPVKAIRRRATASDWRALFALNQFAQQLDQLAASGKVDDRLASVDYIAGLAAAAGIAFKVPKSKFSVPWPYASTLEQFAAQYLGDPDRWLEVAALNGLRAPYVDEAGFDLPLLAPGRGNQVLVADASNLRLGQSVWIGSTTATQTQARVLRIDENGPGTYAVTVDGAGGLERYQPAQNAGLHAYLPDTVNSQMMVYVPSDREPTTADQQTKPIPGLDQFDPLLEVAGADVLLTSGLDLAVTPDGDQPLAVGLQNAIQTAKIRLATPQGSLLLHPQFGLPLQVGQSLADLDARGLLKAVRNLFADDPSFTAVRGASVLVSGVTAAIRLTVGLRGVDQDVPITVNVLPP